VKPSKLRHYFKKGRVRKDASEMKGVVSVSKQKKWGSRARRDNSHERKTGARRTGGKKGKCWRKSGCTNPGKKCKGKQDDGRGDQLRVKYDHPLPAEKGEEKEPSAVEKEKQNVSRSRG